MNLNAILSLLVHKGVVTFDEADKLSHELKSFIVDTNFAAAHRDVGYIIEKLTPKLAPKKTIAKNPKP